MEQQPASDIQTLASVVSTLAEGQRGLIELALRHDAAIAALTARAHELADWLDKVEDLVLGVDDDLAMLNEILPFRANPDDN